MSGQYVECKVCKNVGKSELRGSFWISFILFWFFAMIPGIIYMIWRRGGSGVCRSCGSSHIIPYHGARTKVIQQDALAQTALIPHAPSKQSGNVQQIQCPDCREYIRYDARKCKHCGSMVGQA